MNPQFPAVSRRYFLGESALGLGGMALSSLMAGRASAAAPTAAEDLIGQQLPHFAPKAKSVIFLFMTGGPSQLDLFDYKPTLKKYEGQEVPDEVLKGAELPF